MAQDATGAATSPDNIPTYNTAVDNPSGKGSNAQMAAIQTALSARVGAPAGVVTGEGVVWNGTTWVRSSVTKLASGNFGPVVNADIDPAAAIAASKLASYPSNGGVFLAGDGTWKAAGSTTYRKTTAKTVNTSLAETDLLNGEITIAANVLGTTGALRFTTTIDALNNSGGVVSFRLKLKLGATTIFDTGTGNTIVASNTNRAPFHFSAWGTNLGATNSQAWSGMLAMQGSNFGMEGGSTTGEGGLPLVQSGSAGGTIGVVPWLNTSAVDTTASQVLALTITMSVSNALAETKLYNALVEII